MGTMIPNEYLQVLKKIVSRLAGRPIHWAVTGSLGMALQGVPLPIHDIDLQTDKDGALEIARSFAEYVVSPVAFRESEHIRSYFGILEIDGVKVEIMGDLQKYLADGQRWEDPARVERHRRWIELDEMRIPVLDLEYEYQAYLKMGRLERAALLRRWLDSALAG